MNEAPLPDQKAYPQFQESIVNNAPTQEGSFGLSALRHHPAVHHRPGKLLSCAETDGGCTFTFASQARESRLSYTHETSLHLYSPASSVLSSVQLSLCFWREDIFRVTLTGPSPYADPFAGIPEMG